MHPKDLRSCDLYGFKTPYVEAVRDPPPYLEGDGGGSLNLVPLVFPASGSCHKKGDGRTLRRSKHRP